MIKERCTCGATAEVDSTPEFETKYIEKWRRRHTHRTTWTPPWTVTSPAKTYTTNSYVSDVKFQGYTSEGDPMYSAKTTSAASDTRTRKN